MLSGNLIKQFVAAVIEAANKNKWQHVLDLGAENIEEMLEESDVETVEQAVHKFKDLEECVRDEEMKLAQQNTLLMAYFFNAHGIGELLTACEAPQNNSKIRDLLFDEMTAARDRVTDRNSALTEYCGAIIRIGAAVAKLVSPEDETGDVLHEVLHFLRSRITVSLHYAFDLSEQAVQSKLEELSA